MDPATASIVAAGIGAAGSLASAGVSAGATTNLNKKNREWQESMYERQRLDAIEDRDFSRDFAREQMEYLSAPNQVALLREAGLNPALAYGGSVTSPAGSAQVQTRGAAAPMPSHTANPWDAISSSFNNIMGEVADIVQANAAKQNADSTSMRVDSEILRNAAEINLIDSQTAGQMLANEFAGRTMEDRVKTVTAGLDNTISQTNLNVSKISEVESMVNLNNEMAKRAAQEVELFKARIDEINSNISLTPYKAAELRASAWRQLNQAEHERASATLKAIQSAREAIATHLDAETYESRKGEVISRSELVQFDNLVKDTRFKTEQRTKWISTLAGAIKDVGIGVNQFSHRQTLGERMTNNARNRIGVISDLFGIRRGRASNLPKKRRRK